jgi:hypothetical protein
VPVLCPKFGKRITYPGHENARGFSESGSIYLVPRKEENYGMETCGSCARRSQNTCEKHAETRSSDIRRNWCVGLARSTGKCGSYGGAGAGIVHSSPRVEFEIEVAA